MTTKAHQHAEVIKAWADGKQIQCRIDPRDIWGDVVKPEWDHLEYRVKPAVGYPSITLRSGQTAEIWQKAPNGHHECVIYIANEAVRQACDTGQIVTREEFDRAVGDRAARDMAVARAVDAWYCQTFSSKQPNTENYLADIIKGIKP